MINNSQQRIQDFPDGGDANQKGEICYVAKISCKLGENEESLAEREGSAHPKFHYVYPSLILNLILSLPHPSQLVIA